MLRVLDLFSGIGGFSLGLERTGGFKTVAFCEIEPFCQRVLRKNWPNVPIFGDVHDLGARHGQARVNVGRVDVVCGGFPCQPFSSASRGRSRGREDDRYLWPEMLRLVQECGPSWVIGENVTHLRGVDFDRVVSDLDGAGYEVAVMEIPACAVGLDHRRSRLWFLGYSDSNRQSRLSVNAETPWVPWSDCLPQGVGAQDGLSGRLDRSRVRALGNAVVPQVVQVIGEAILRAEQDYGAA